MNFDGVDFEIMTTIKNGQFNGSNTIANLHAIFGQNAVNNLISQNYIVVENGLAKWTEKAGSEMTPIDLSENSDLNSDSSSSLLLS